jgi:hypothetical protein
MPIATQERENADLFIRTSDRAIRDPTFSLCTADARCGQASSAQIIENEDGTTSALLYVEIIPDDLNFDGADGFLGHYLLLTVEVRCSCR